MERSNQIGCESNNNIEMGGAYIPDKFQTDIEKRATNSYYKRNVVKIGQLNNNGYYKSWWL